MSQSDDWLAAERERHGPVTDQERHRAYDAVLDARAAWRDADKLHIPPPDD